MDVACAERVQDFSCLKVGDFHACHQLKVAHNLADASELDG